MKATPEQTEMILNIARNLDKYFAYNIFDRIEVSNVKETIYFEPRSKWTTVTLGSGDYPTEIEVESDELIKLLLEWQDREYSKREGLSLDNASRFLTEFKPPEGFKQPHPNLPINS